MELCVKLLLGLESAFVTIENDLFYALWNLWEKHVYARMIEEMLYYHYDSQSGGP